MQTEVRLENYVVNDADDLYKTIIVHADNDYYDSHPIYDYLSVWHVVDDFNTFVEYISLLSPEEVIAFRDCDDGNILHAFAESNKSIEYYEFVFDYIDGENFVNLLTTGNNAGIYPIAIIKDLDIFKTLIGMITITGSILNQIVVRGTRVIKDFLAGIIDDWLNIPDEDVDENTDEVEDVDEFVDEEEDDDDDDADDSSVFEDEVDDEFNDMIDYSDTNDEDDANDQD